MCLVSDFNEPSIASVRKWKSCLFMLLIFKCVLINIRHGAPN